jgi:spore coat protein D
MLPPKFVAYDHKVRRMQPIIQPVVHVDRFNIVDVPKPIYKPKRKRVVEDPKARYYYSVCHTEHSVACLHVYDLFYQVIRSNL